MKGVDLFDLGLTEEYVRAAAMNAGDLHLARVSVQHQDIYKVIAGKGSVLPRPLAK
jgi:ribosome biogenesis GTPase